MKYKAALGISQQKARVCCDLPPVIPIVLHGLLDGVLYVGWSLVQPVRRAVVTRARVELKASAAGHVSESSEDQLVPDVVVGELIPEELVETLAVDLTSLKSCKPDEIDRGDKNGS